MQTLTIVEAYDLDEAIGEAIREHERDSHSDFDALEIENDLWKLEKRVETLGTAVEELTEAVNLIRRIFDGVAQVITLEVVNQTVKTEVSGVVEE